MYTAIPIMYENSSSKHISNNKIYNNNKSPYNRTSCDEDKVFPTSHTEMNLYHVTKCEKITYATKLKMIMLLLSF